MNRKKKARMHQTVRISDIVTMYTNLEIHDTGSGGKALHHPLDDGGHILITKRVDGLSVPTNRDRTVWCGIYAKDGQCTSPRGIAESVPVSELEGWMDLQLRLAADRGEKVRRAVRAKLDRHLADRPVLEIARSRLQQAASEIEASDTCIAVAFKTSSRTAQEIRARLINLHAELKVLLDQLPLEER